MFMLIADVLPPDDIVRVREKAEGLVWRDGARTAGGRARAVKRNEQADLSKADGLHAFLLSAIELNSVVRAAARPRQFSRLLLSRTGEGGAYGKHVDNAIMGGVRSDLSFTLFLSDPDTYEGGALLIDTPSGVHRAKPVAGDLVLYASSAIHEVEPVTSGVRLACVGWIESRVRRADQRDLLLDLETVRASMPKEADEALTLDKAISNLLRMWADA